MRREKNKLFIGKVTITASRWPWQTRTGMAMLSDPKTEGAGMKYGWKSTPGMGRFGGGWNWNIGLQIAKTTILLELLFGTISISWYQPKKDK